MKLLKQKYHGLPGIGINGKNGNAGKNAETVDINYINDFFDGEYIDIGTFIYAAKRTFNHGDNNTQTEIDTSSLTAAWQLTLDELSYADSLNSSLYNATVESSTNTSSYINYSTFYYTGTIFSDKNITDPESDMYQHYNMYNNVKMDLNGDNITMALMLKSLDSPDNVENINDKQYKTEYDRSVDNDFNLITNDIDSYYNVRNRQTHYEFVNGEILMNYPGNYDNLNQANIIIPYDTNDALFAIGNIQAGINYENGNFLNNINCSNYYENYPNDNSYSYVKDDDFGINYLTDTNICYAKLTSNELKTLFKYSNSSFLNHPEDPSQFWYYYYKTSFVDVDERYYSNDDIVDFEGQRRYGVASPTLYRNKGANTNINNIYDLTSDFSYIDRLKNNDNYGYAVINTNSSLYVYYSLSENDTQLFVPTTLKSKYQAGDVLYFYTNKNDFNLNYNILYMVVLTNNLLNCTPSQLIEAAQLVSPLEIKNFSTNNTRLCNYNNVGVLLNNIDTSVDDKAKYTYRSFIGIADNYTTSPLLLCTGKDKNFINFDAVYNSNNISLKFNNQDNLLNINVDSSTIIPNIKFSNLNIIPDNITENTNMEVKNIVYDKNIKLYSNNFIRPLLDLDLYVDKNDTAVFEYTVDGNDYFYNIKTLTNYFYGCDIYNKNMELVKTITSTNETLQVELVPSIDNDTYYIQMFATNNYGLKYFSKFTKLSITYKPIYYINNRKILSTPKSKLAKDKLNNKSLTKNNKSLTKNIIFNYKLS